ncbi:MAG: hypothetical protein IKD15_01545 [Clostridia bacterium]|nr:hypothetical protein [Clostridia bacterium]
MFLKLRVLCTILSALCLGFALTAWAIWGPIWLVILGGGALLFFLLMRIFKQCQENQEAKNNQPSFLNPATTDQESDANQTKTQSQDE